MYLRIAALGERAEILSYLLRKHPDNLFERKVGNARIYAFFDAYRNTYASATLLALPDPLDYVQRAPPGAGIDAYVNDRQFALSSIFCSYMRDAYRSAIAGDTGTPEVDAETPVHLEIEAAPLCTTMPGEEIEMLWLPLGYEVTIEERSTELPPPDGEPSPNPHVYLLRLRGVQTVQAMLRHLLVLLPAIDDYRHYFIDEQEFEHLRNYGADWLDQHPLRDVITRRYLRYRDVIQLAVAERVLTEPLSAVAETAGRLHEQRHDAVLKAIAGLHPQRIIEIGCNGGDLTYMLAQLAGKSEVTGTDPSMVAIQYARRRERTLDGSIPTFYVSALPYYDTRLVNRDPHISDAFILCEVLEHLNPAQMLQATELIFDVYRPCYVVVTTLNRDYNATWPNLAGDRVGWSRAEFAQWVDQVAVQWGYRATTGSIGEPDATLGSPAQMVVFEAGRR
jgi:3' terminal RNA ribose 2'-O-methyltransferase Hen1